MTPEQLISEVRAALDETERLARAAMRGDGRWEYRDMRERDPDTYPWQVFAPDARLVAGTGFAPQEARHIAVHDPAAVLRQVAVMREIVDAYELACRTTPSEVSSFIRGQDDGYRQAYEDVLRALARGLGTDDA